MTVTLIEPRKLDKKLSGFIYWFSRTICLSDRNPASAVVDGKGVVGVGDAVAEEGFAWLAVADEALVVEVVAALATGTVGDAGVLEGDAFGDVCLVVAVAAGEVVAGDYGVVGAQFGNVGQTHDEAGETHVEAGVVVELGLVDGGAAGGVGENKLLVAGYDGTPLTHAVAGTVELGNGRYGVIGKACRKVAELATTLHAIRTAKKEQEAKRQPEEPSLHPRYA